MEEGKNRGLNLPVSILVAAIIIAGSIIYVAGVRNRGGIAPATEKTENGQVVVSLEELLKIREGDVILGEPTAPVTLIEYGDYQCPFCGRFFTQTEPSLREDYIRPGKVKMVYRDLAFLGPESQAAAEAAACAKEQGKFWAYHDELFRQEVADGVENNGNLNRDLFLKIAAQTELDVSGFTSCLDSKKYAASVKATTQEAQRLGINATPTSFINGRQIQGAQPYASFQSVIDGFLK